MTKRNLFLIAAVTLPVIIIWLLHGFIMWNLNPAEWSITARAVMVFVSVSTTALAVGLVIEIFKD